MANRSKLVAIALPLVAAAASLAIVLLLCSTGSSEDGYLGRVGMPWGAGTVTVLPFSPTDVLPLLPRGVAMAALRALRGVSDIFPVFVGAASGGGSGSATGTGGTVTWKGACFYENEAWLVFHNESGSKYGGGTLHIKDLEVAQNQEYISLPQMRRTIPRDEMDAESGPESDTDTPAT